MNRSTIVFAASFAAFACQPAADGPSAPPVDQRVEIPALGFAFADLPTGCSVTRNEGIEVEISCSSSSGSVGVISLEVLSADEGTNVLVVANDQRDWFEAQPGGVYKGNRELVTPHGAGYTARGRYDEDGQAIEETRVLALHPDTTRILVYRFTYGEGDDTQARVGQLLYLVGETEALAYRMGVEEPASAEEAVLIEETP